MTMITQLKHLHLVTDLSEGAEIVAPAAPAWRAVADHVRRVVREAAGLDLPVRSDGPSDEASFAGGHRILLGSAMNNPAVLTLYRNRMAFTDDAYPGEGGFEARTIHNPFGHGRNALLLGASDVAGAAAAVERLRDALTRDGVRLSRLNAAASLSHERLAPSDPPERHVERAREAFAGNVGRGAIEGAITAGLHHHLTGDPACARIFRDVLFYYFDLVEQEHAGEWNFEHMIATYFWTSRLVYVYDLIEESDSFTDPDRLRFTNALLGLTRHTAAQPYFRQEPELDIRQNHSTFAALSLFSGARYFRKYYGIEDFAPQERIADLIFQGQAKTFKPNDDAGGGGYCWLVPNHLVTYDLMRGDLRYFEGGHYRDLADYGILITDNLGVPCAFGDTGTCGSRSSPPPLLVETFSKAAWHYNDGRYAWAMRWVGSPLPRGVAAYYRRVEPVPPDHLSGVAVARLDPPAYEWVQRHAFPERSSLSLDSDVGDVMTPAGRGGRAPRIPGVPPEQAFDKLSLRAGFGEQDEYLLLEGLSAFAHGHEDGNSILRLTWRGRMFMDEADYIWSRPEHHSSVVVACDGASGKMPPLARLDWAEDFGPFAVTRTTVPGVNGADWSRTIFWKKGRCFLVADALLLRRDADYDLRCLWRALGEPAPRNDGLTVVQDGVAFHLQSADDSAKTLTREPRRIPAHDPWAPYPHARSGVHILSERLQLHGSPGEVVRFFNLLSAGAAEERPDVEVRPAGPEAVQVLDRGEPLVFGALNGGPGAFDDFRFTGEAFLLTPEEIVGVGVTEVRLGRVAVSASNPFSVLIAPGEGRADLRVRKRTEFQVQGMWGARLVIDGLEYRASLDGRVNFALDPGVHRVGFPRSPFEALAEVVRKPRIFRQEMRPKQNLVRPSRSPLHRVWAFSVDGPVRALCVADGQIAAGTASGDLACLGLDGEPVCRQRFEREIRAVLPVDIDGDGRAELVAGGMDCALSLLNPSGSARWSHAFARSHGRDQIVNAIAAADLTGDGVVEILAVTDGWLCFCFAPDGRLLWEAPVRYHAAQSVVPCDVDGDGRMELIVGTEYHSSDLLEADGRPRWMARGGPGFTALGALDLDACGVQEVLFGSLDAHVHALDARTGATRWKTLLAGGVRHAALLPEERRVAAGDDGGNVSLLGPDGTRLWRCDLGDPVTGLVAADVNSDGRPELVAATSSGLLALIALDGRALGTHQMSSPVSRLSVARRPGLRPYLIAGCESGAVEALAWR